MHIDSAPRHRHFVVLPLCALVVCATLWAGFVRGPSVVASAITVLADGEVDQTDGVSLRNGSLLISSDALIQVEIDMVTVTGFAGSLHVSRTPVNLRIAALTSPALLAAGEFRFLIPAGFQGEWKTVDLPSTIDPSQIAAELGRLRPVPEDFLRESADRLTTTVSAVRSAERGSSLLDALKAGTDAHLRVLAAAASDESAVVPLLSRLRDDDLHLLLSVHPAFRTAAWSLPLVIPTWESVRVLTFPLADTLPAAAAAFAVERWEQGSRDLLRSAEDPAMFANALLLASEPLRNRAIQREYPERLQRYASVFLSLTEPYAADLSREAQAVRDAWQNVAGFAVEHPSPPATRDAQSSSIAPVPPAPEEAAVMTEQVRQLLLQADALLTLETQFTAIDRQTVRVAGVLFAGADTDHAYSFTLNLQTHQVTAIIRDGNPMPFPMSWEAFTGWLRI